MRTLNKSILMYEAPSVYYLQTSTDSYNCLPTNNINRLLTELFMSTHLQISFSDPQTNNICQYPFAE